MGDEAESNLEMRCSADEAWYDGTLRVSEVSKDLIVVHFNDFDDEEDETFHRSVLWDPAKLRSRVRVRSVQLQDSQCRSVYESQKICGCLDDGEDRKYYDCEVTEIAKRTHAFKDGGEECLCRFTVYWLDGPKKTEKTVIGCAEVCFLSLESPEEDPMVKNLLTILAGHGDQPRRKPVKSGPKTVPKSAPPKSVATPKPVVLPRPRTPSPSLELAPLKKQPSREPSPLVEAPTQTVPELARTKSLPIGSKKKRIMQAAVQVANENDKVGTPALKDHNSQQFAAGGHEDAATGHGDESVAPERGVQSGALRAGERKRSVRGKAKAAAAPEVINHHEAPREEDDSAPCPTGPVKKRLKLTTKSNAKTVASETVIVAQSLEERVKLKTAQKNHCAAATPEAAPPPPPAAASSPATEAAKQLDNIVQSLGERVKLKTAQKNPSASGSPVVDAHKDSLQRIGKQFVRKQVTKRKLIQLEDPAPDPLRSKFDKVKPRTLASKPKEPVAPPEPPKAASEPPSPSPSTAELETLQLKAQKRKAGRPRKRPLPEPPSSEQNQSPPEEETPTSNPRSKRNASQKRPRDEEEELHHEEEQKPRHEEEQEPRHEEEQKPCHEGEQEPRHEEEQEPRHEEEQPRDEEEAEEEQQPLDEEEQSHHDTISETALRNTGKRKTLLIIGDLNEEAQPDHDETSAEQEAETPYADNKISIAEKFRDIQNKFHNNGAGTLSTSQAAQELISLAGLKPTGDDSDATEDDERQRRSSLVGRRQLVIADDDDDVDVVERGEDAPSRGKPDEWSAVEEEGKRGRVLVLENMEADASAYDAMRVLMAHTEGVCAVHVLPVLEFCVTATGYALYRDGESAGKALRWLTSLSRFVISSNGRPWIVSQAKEVYGPKLYGFVAHTAYKSDDFGMCGLISDQPHAHDFAVVTERDNSAYYKAQQMSKAYEEQKKWRKELYDRIVQHDKKS